MQLNRRWTALIVLLLIILSSSARPAAAQSVDDQIAAARRTLDEIDRLINAIQARNGAPSDNHVPSADAGQWISLFDGKSLEGWKQTDFGGGGDVHVENSFRGDGPAIVTEMGATLSGFNWTKDVPRTNYEVSLEFLKIQGSDFGLGLTFPVADSCASLILGGWGGGVVGISSIDHRDASENDTTQYLGFTKDRWYRVRVRVTPSKIETWLDNKKIIDQVITGHVVSLRPGDISRQIPLGIATYQTSAAYRNIRLRRL